MAPNSRCCCVPHVDLMFAREPARIEVTGDLTALDAAQLDYKGMTADRDRLVDLLLSMARGG